MNITVYLASYFGNDKVFSDKIIELGKWIGENGNTLVYGGSKSGLMGILAETTINAGGKAIGVEPQFFIDSAIQYDGLTQLIVTKNMSERKAKMIELGEAFIAFPGGTGTLEEISEIMSMKALNHLDAPCIVYNLNGFYDDLKNLLQKMVEKGLSTEERLKDIHFVNNIDEIKEIIKSNK